MDQVELLKHVVGVLESINIPYMIVGSWGSGTWGESRFTYDIDIVIGLAAEDVGRLVAAFPASDFYLSEIAIRQALRDHGQFNLIHSETSLKVDFMLEGTTPWAQQQLGRRRRVQLPSGLSTFVAAPEDIIISKMLYYREGGSEKHLRDISGMLKVSGDQIDRSYVVRWAEELGVTEVWQAVLRRLGE